MENQQPPPPVPKLQEPAKDKRAIYTPTFGRTHPTGSQLDGALRRRQTTTKQPRPEERPTTPEGPGVRGERMMPGFHRAPQCQPRTCPRSQHWETQHPLQHQVSHHRSVNHKTIPTTTKGIYAEARTCTQYTCLPCQRKKPSFTQKRSVSKSIWVTVGN